MWIVDGISASWTASTRAHRWRAGVRGVRGLLVHGTPIVRLCAAMAVAGACSRHGQGGDLWNHPTLRRTVSRKHDATVKDRERHCAVAAKLPAVASKFCIKLAHNAVCGSDDCFLRCAMFQGSSFPAQVPRRDTSWNSALRNVQAHSTNWPSLLVPPGPDSWRLDAHHLSRVKVAERSRLFVGRQSARGRGSCASTRACQRRT